MGDRCSRGDKPVAMGADVAEETSLLLYMGETLAEEEIVQLLTAATGQCRTN